MDNYNVYCDESCHLEFDKSPIMVMGAIWVNQNHIKDVTREINEIKSRYNVGRFKELKWTKLSPSLYKCYEELICYFFDNINLHFRGLIVDNKNKFNAEYGTYDEWFYKMYFRTIQNIINPNSNYNIFIDIKDTNSKQRIDKLHQVLCNDIYDFDHKIIKKIQAVRSEQIALMQIVDLLIGALSYYSRGHYTSMAKLNLIKFIINKSQHNFSKNSLSKEEKFNIFHLQLGEK